MPTLQAAKWHREIPGHTARQGSTSWEGGEPTAWQHACQGVLCQARPGGLWQMQTSDGLLGTSWSEDSGMECIPNCQPPRA